MLELSEPPTAGGLVGVPEYITICDLKTQKQRTNRRRNQDKTHTPPIAIAITCGHEVPLVVVRLEVAPCAVHVAAALIALSGGFIGGSRGGNNCLFGL